MADVNQTATDDSSLSGGSDEKQCHFCSSQDSKYLCPRCGVRYCSVLCYRSPAHLLCSEEFFKQCIQEELQSEEDKGTEGTEGRRQMVEALRRVYEEGTEDDVLDSDDEELELAARLQGIDLNNADAVWASLSQAERGEFESLVASGDVAGILPVWAPWWCRPKKPLIEEVNKTEESDTTPQYPPLVPDIPPFYKICSIKPSACLDFNLCNVLAGYAITERHYNGEAATNGTGAATCVLRLSGTLSANANYSDREVAVQAVALNAINILKLSSEDTRLLYPDVLDILSSKQWVLYALSGAHHILSRAKTQLKSRQNPAATSRSGGPKESFSHRFPESQSGTSTPEFTLSKTNLNAAMKKLEFYMSWVKAYYSVEPVT